MRVEIHECPRCGASLHIDSDAIVDGVVRCEYCNSSFTVEREPLPGETIRPTQQAPSWKREKNKTNSGSSNTISDDDARKIFSFLSSVLGIGEAFRSIVQTLLRIVVLIFALAIIIIVGVIVLRFTGILTW